MTIAVLAGFACLAGIFATASTSERNHAVGGAALGTMLLGGTSLGGIPFALLFMTAPLIVAPRARRKYAGSAAAWLPVAAIGTAALVAYLWSPEPQGALNAAGGWLALVSAIFLYGSVIQTPRELRAVAAYIAVGAVALAVSVVLFRLSSPLESAYYRSEVSQFFLGTAGTDLFSGNVLTSNNAIETQRAAGFLYVNVNRASMILGVAAVTLYGLSKTLKSRLLASSALFLAISVVFTGSKTGLTLILSVLILRVAGKFVSQQTSSASRVLGVGITVAVTVYAVRAALLASSDFLSSSAATLEPRKYLWSEALRAISEQPLFGLGFGGWQQRWMDGGVTVPFVAAIRPAHNWLLQAWMDGGILLALTHLIFAVLVVLSAMRGFGKTLNNGDPRWFYFSFAPVWALVHGLGDNTALYGDWATIPLLAIALGWTGHSRKHPRSEALNRPGLQFAEKSDRQNP